MVFAVTRSADKARILAQEGIRPLVADLNRPQSLRGATLAQVPASVLFAVGYDRDPARPLEQVYVEGLRHVLDWLPERTQRFLYVSSTGVYGDAAGQVVDEDSPCRPGREGGRACLAGERLLASHPLGSRTVILRLGGLYGPGRILRAEALRRGEPIDAPAAGHLNLIHVEDAAAIVILADQKAAAGRVYNVVDGHQVQRADYFRELARLLGAPPPRFSPPSADSASARRAQENKIVSNRRLMSELAPPLAFPSYREGLAAIVGAVGNAG
jgi:nucleoside-diphosphate-sugar epimerase